MDAVLAPPEEDTDLSGFEDITPCCQLVKISAPSSLLQALVEMLNGQPPEENCDEAAAWVVSFACSRREHSWHHYLACEPHHQQLGGAVINGKPTEWVAL